MLKITFRNEIKMQGGDKMTQKQQLLKLFADNDGTITLGQIMQTTLAAEYRARISDLRREGYNILCTEKQTASDNVYTLITEPVEYAAWRKTLAAYPANHPERKKYEKIMVGKREKVV